jgi:hypothetical protein
VEGSLAAVGEELAVVGVLKTGTEGLDVEVLHHLLYHGRAVPVAAYGLADNTHHTNTVRSFSAPVRLQCGDASLLRTGVDEGDVTLLSERERSVTEPGRVVLHVRQVNV